MTGHANFSIGTIGLDATNRSPDLLHYDLLAAPENMLVPPGSVLPLNVHDRLGVKEVHLEVHCVFYAEDR